MNTAGQLGGFICAVVFGYLVQATGNYHQPVWVVAGVGRVLPGPLWSALLRRIRDDDPWDADEEVVPLDLVDMVVRSEGLLAPADALTRAGCPVAPELMREMN